MTKPDAGPSAPPAGGLLERDAELAAIEAALVEACAGSGRLLFVEAHPGLGKSRLLGAARERAEARGMLVLAARGSELEREHGFGLVLQLLEPVLARAGDDERRELQSGAASLARPLFEGGAAAGSSPDEQLFALLHGLHWLTANLAEQAALLISADDLHWSDRPSVRYLAYLAQRLEELPVAVVASARPAEPSAPQDLLLALRSHERASTLRPAALSGTAVGRIVRGRMSGVQEAFVEACTGVTAGNPYLLHELLADAADRGLRATAAGAERVRGLAPKSVLEAALGRLRRLPGAAAPMARAVAVLGEEARIRHAAELAGLDRETAATVADALAGAEILASVEPLRFVHPLLRSAIYVDLPRATRGEAHLRAARILAREGAAHETVAAHLLAATPGGEAWVVEQLRRAAARALGQGAAESAVLYLKRALEEPPPPELRAQVLLELGRAEALGGQAGTIERMEQALDLVGDPRHRAEILRELGWMLQKRGDLRRAVEALERGLVELQGVVAEDLREALEVARLQIAHLGTVPLETEHAAEAGGRADRLMRDPGRSLSANERGLLSALAAQRLFQARPVGEVVALARRAWGGGALLAEEGPDSPTLWHVVGCLSWSDALQESEAIIEAALARARREGSIVTQALALYARSWPRYWRGDVSASAADAEAAVVAWSGEFTMYLPVAAFWLASSLLELGDVERAAAAVDYPDAEQRWGQTNMYAPLLIGQGAVALARGDAAAAAARLRAAGESVLALSIRNPAVFSWRSHLSAAERALGNLDAAREAAAEEVALAREFGAPRPLGMALRCSGLAEGGRGGIALLGGSVEALRRSPAALELARALTDLGAELRRQGSRAKAREPLREALAMAQRFGATALERRAFDELVASGAKPRRREVVGAVALTPSERRVAELAVAGLTNREIAQNLFVTVKAVQWHLRNVYRKLGIRSRDELRGTLDR